jgi:hypothetical protein
MPLSRLYACASVCICVRCVLLARFEGRTLRYTVHFCHQVIGFATTVAAPATFQRIECMALAVIEIERVVVTTTTAAACVC